MGVLGARSGDLARCLAGDTAACERVAFGFYVFPHLQRWLEDLDLVRELPPIIRIPIPRPDPPPFDEFAAALLAPAFGEPNPQPSLVRARLDALKKTASSLEDLSTALNNEIERVSQFMKE